MKQSINWFIAICCVTLTFSCKKSGTNPAPSSSNQANVKLPTVSTAPIQSITSSTATTGGNVLSEGSTPITAKGVCWSTSPNPTMSSAFSTIDGSGTSSYTSNLVGLLAETTYYLRAYASNSSGTAYGNELIFKTNPKPNIYAVGKYGAPSSAIFWDGFGLNYLNKGTFQNCIVATSVYVSAGDIYITGNLPFIWKNGVGTRLQNDVNSYANSLCVAGSDVYIAGTSGVVDQRPIFWKNGTYNVLSNSEGTAKAVFIYNNQVYIGGSSQSLPAIWRDGVRTLLSTEKGEVKSVTVVDNTLYAVGYLTFGDYNKAMLWKNDSPIVLADNGIANAIAVSGKDVYVVGVRGYEDGTIWKNGVASSLLGATEVNSIFINGPDIYVGGKYDYKAAVWKNGNVTIVNTYGTINSVFVYP
jgi:hypothetical protein